MRDRPEGSALLALARKILLDEIVPLLPPERRGEARLVARAIAIAERERAAGETPFTWATRELAEFYQKPLTPALSPLCGERETPADPRIKSREEGERLELWRRFALDLRAGTFDEDAAREREARAMLWRLTVAKLRMANPRFLAEHGLARSGGFE
jgi:hypothetical protein